MKTLNFALVLGLIQGSFSGSISGSISRAEGAKPKYVSTTLRLYSNHDYVRKHAAPDFWAFMPYYQPQIKGSYCSVASTAMLVNAARANQPLTTADELISQPALLEKVKDEFWNTQMSEKGRGVTLDELKDVVLKSLRAYGFDRATVEVFHVDALDEKTAKKIHMILIANEKAANDFILANFLQSEYTGDPEGAVGHISPVGAYDEGTERVLILDSDRQYYEPYWVSEKTFIKGMMTFDKVAKANRGFIWVKLN